MEKIQKYYLPNLIRAVAIGFSLWQLYALSFAEQINNFKTHICCLVACACIFGSTKQV